MPRETRANVLELGAPPVAALGIIGQVAEPQEGGGIMRWVKTLE